MTSVLYYSNLCPNCKQVLQLLSKSKVKDEIHFICIDRRIQAQDGSIAVIMQNGSQIKLPEQITKVPALMLLNKGNAVIFGMQILEYLKPKEEAYQANAVMNNGEPMAYVLGGGGSLHGVVSDNYSFLDQTAESLSAKGDGGLRQMHSYATINAIDNIETPPDNYVPDKVKGETVETLSQKRNSDVPQQIPRT
jgi:hypothetical protein